MLRETYPYYLGSMPQQPNADLVVRDKYTGEIATRVALADEAAVAQEPQVVRDPALGHQESTRELSHRQLLVLDEPEDAQAGGVR